MLGGSCSPTDSRYGALAIKTNHEALEHALDSAKSREHAGERARVRCDTAMPDEVERHPARMGLGELRRAQRQSHGAEPAEQHEDRAPAEPFGQIGADRRAQRRGQRHRHHDEGDRPGRRVAVVDVADDRPAEHQPGAAAERLQHPAADQHRQRPRRAAYQRTGEKQREPGEQHRPPPEAVGDRAVNELAGGNPDEVQRQDKLRLGGAAVEHGRDHRQHRHDHVQGRKADRGDGGEKRQRRSGRRAYIRRHQPKALQGIAIATLAVRG